VSVRFGLNLINVSPVGEPAVVQRFAVAAERAGWDGLFVWDHVRMFDRLAWDPWVLLTAAACVTERIHLGTNVTPVPRRRPQVLAAQVMTLDRLSGGRVILGVGLGGAVDELEQLGEETDLRRRVELLEAGLDVITLECDAPVWVGGETAASRRRARRHDGWTVGTIGDPSGTVIRTPEQLRREVVELDGAAIDVVAEGISSPDGHDHVQAYADAGATWWLEAIYGLRAPVDALLARVEAGPPRAAPAAR
jgi:hypothetical protein